MRNSFVLSAVSVLGLCAACASQAPAGQSGGPAAFAEAESPKASAAQPANAASTAKLPDFTVTTLEGETFRLSDHVGKNVVVLSFWATWCQPCLEELPHLDEIYQEKKDDGLVILAVSMDEPSSVSQVNPAVQRLGLRMPVAVDSSQVAMRLYNRNRDAPKTVVIDRSGNIVRQSAGYNPGDEDVLAQEIDTLLGQ